MQTSIPNLIGGENRQITSTGNYLLDKKIADGLPLRSLTLIDGANDTGKCVLNRQIMYGAMKQGCSVGLFTTGNTTRSFIKQMESVSPEVTGYFSWGYLSIFPRHIAGLMEQSRDREYYMVSVGRHQAQHGAGGDHMNPVDRDERVWPALM